MWEVWKARDKAIFSNKFQRVEVILSKIISSFFEWNTDIFVGMSNICHSPSLLIEHPVGCFDGADSNGVYEG